MNSTNPAVLVLESGRAFAGTSFGAKRETLGEVVFNTSMSGYQEILTDPSYAGQIVAMTAPQIGNTGINLEDTESDTPQCRGLVIRELSPLASNWRSSGDLDRYLEQHGIVGIQGVDTRALTRAIRNDGAQRGIIAVGRDAPIDQLKDEVRKSPEMVGQDLCSVVTCSTPYDWKRGGPWTSGDTKKTSPVEQRFRVVAYDFGIKHNILRDLYGAGCDITVVPANTPAKEALARDADGYFLSNGPGDPAAVNYAIEIVRELATFDRPVFGICLGHQILSLALGAKTFKLPFGHHGGNHPVKVLETGKVEITSQNHGFAVDSHLPDNVVCTHINLYDNTVEGIRVKDKPIFGVQYHPESSPGPHDANHLFDRFVDAMRATQ